MFHTMQKGFFSHKQKEVTDREQEAHQNFLKAKKLYDTARYHDAITHCKDAVKLNPSDPKIYQLLGRCQARNPNLRWQKQAESNFLKAIELDPWNSDYVYDLAKLYKGAKMLLKAKKYFIKTLELDRM